MIEYWPYMIPPDYIRRLFKPAKPVRHQPLGRRKRPQAYGRHSAAKRQTCPVCGRKLVNTYFQNGEWKCRRCWENDTT